MLAESQLRSMDDKQLLAAVHAELHPSTSTALERELLNRFERLLGELESYQRIADLLDSCNVDAEEMENVIESLKILDAFKDVMTG